MEKAKKVRHILGVSGGKDSTALAVYMRNKIPGIEYFFCDTGSELPETYSYLDKLEKYLGEEIKRLKPRGFSNREGKEIFETLLEGHGNYLPSATARWCTVLLKLRPLENFIGDDEAISYVGIRADEDGRKGHISSKKNIKTVFPFIENKIDKSGVYRILEDAGLGRPKYYDWRSRSGCYFCFFQRKIEWIGLLENHPELFRKAMSYEKTDEKSGKRFTWNQKESLEELSMSERIKGIKAFHEKMLAQEKAHPTNKPLYQVIEEAMDQESDELPCLICQL